MVEYIRGEYACCGAPVLDFSVNNSLSLAMSCGMVKTMSSVPPSCMVVPFTMRTIFLLDILAYAVRSDELAEGQGIFE